MSFFDTQNPGIGGLDELTDSEILLVQSLNSLGDPNADRILFWDDSAGGYRFLTMGTNLTITGTTLDAAGGSSDITISTTTITGGTNTKVLYNNAGVVGEYTISGSGNVAMTTSPVFTTPNIGSATGSISGNAGTATALQTPRTIGGVSFDGSANITVATATGGFTVSGGNLVLGTNSLTMTGSLAATGARVTKGWFTDLESTNMPTVGGVAILTSLTAPQFTTIELGAASDTTLARVSAGVISVEGKTIVNLTDGGTFLADISVPDEAYGVGWNGSVEVPTKNAIYDKIETLSGATTYTYTAQTGTYSILTSDQVVNCTSGTFTATLPTAVGVTGKFYYIKNTGSGVITIATTSSQTIDGDTTFLLTQQYSSIKVLSNGANWIII